MFGLNCIVYAFALGASSRTATHSIKGAATLAIQQRPRHLGFILARSLF